MDAIRDYLPWLLSAITIASMWLAGNKSTLAWKVSLANQVLWFAWILASQTWGLLPMNVALAFVYSRNLLKWLRAETQALEAARH